MWRAEMCTKSLLYQAVSGFMEARCRSTNPVDWKKDVFFNDVIPESTSDDFCLSIKNVGICMYRQVLSYIGKSAQMMRCVSVPEQKEFKHLCTTVKIWSNLWCAYTECSCLHFIDPQSSLGWKETLWTFLLNPWTKQGQPNQIAQDCVQSSAEYLQGWDINFSKQHVPVFKHPCQW